MLFRCASGKRHGAAKRLQRKLVILRRKWSRDNSERYGETYERKRRRKGAEEKRKDRCLADQLIAS